jgi:hypothetical protein
MLVAIPECFVLCDFQFINNFTFRHDVAWATEIVIRYTKENKPFSSPCLFVLGSLKLFLSLHLVLLSFTCFATLCFLSCVCVYSVFVHFIRMFPFRLTALHVVTYVSDSRTTLTCSLRKPSSIRANSLLPYPLLIYCFHEFHPLMFSHRKIFWNDTVETYRCFGGMYWVYLQSWNWETSSEMCRVASWDSV